MIVIERKENVISLEERVDQKFPEDSLRSMWKYVSRELSVGWNRFQMPPNYNPIVIPYAQPLNFKVYFYVLFDLILSLQ